jgi:hypothetical protein
LVAALLELFYFSFELRRILRRAEELPAPTDPVLDESPANVSDLTGLKFYIEPSPVPGQRIPYPTISDTSEELDLSVVVLMSDRSSTIVDILQSLFECFDSSPSVRYEIMIVDINSKDDTHEKALAFALNHPSVRILRIARTTPTGPACAVACRRTRGHLIFLYNPLDRIPIGEYSQYEQTIRSVMKFSNTPLIAGRWRDIPDDDSVFQSTFNVMLEWVTRLLLRIAGVKASACSHARTFLMTRRSTHRIFAAVDPASDASDLEMLTAAARKGLAVRTAKLGAVDAYRGTPLSRERFGHIQIVLKGIAAYLKAPTPVRARGWTG